MVEKVATPATAVTVSVPERAAPVGFVAKPIVTLPVKVGTTFPNASCAVTWIGGVIAVDCGDAAAGCTVKASCAAAAGVIANAVLAADVRPSAVATSV